MQRFGFPRVAFARDGSGTYSLPEAAFVNGTTIDATSVNSDLSDIASALTQSLSKDGQTTPTASQPMAGFRHTGVGAATAPTDYARADQVIGDPLSYAIDTGSATAYAIAPTPGIAAYVVGLTFNLKAINANTGADPTLAINSLTAGIIYWPDGTSLAAGEIAANSFISVKIASVTSGTPTFHLQTPRAAPVTRAGTQTVTGDKTFTGNTIFSKLIVSGGASFVPQGRLTLATGVAVMVSAQTAKTSIIYTPYAGNLIPIYDGTNVIPTVFAELSNDTTASSTGSAGPAAVTTNSNYDLFVWNDSGTMRLSRGPLWTSDTARGTGAGTTELERIKGIWTNKVAISNGPAANRGTYVGTIRTDGSSQANWNPGGSAAGGTAALLNVWNAYNRVEVMGMVADSTDSWSYNTATIRPANNSSTMRVSFVVGLQEDYFGASYAVSFNNTNVNGGGIAGVGYDSTTVFSGRTGYFANSSAAGNASPQVIGSAVAQPLGFHYFQALEYGNATGTQTWYGDNAGALVLGGFEYKGRC